MMVVTLLCALRWQNARGAKENPAPSAVAISDPAPAIELPAEPDAALTMALAHLDTALNGVYGRSPEEVLRKVSTRGRDCTMVWADHSPSLVFGADPIRPNSLAQILEACAEAVSREH
jgi:hypothetical protein